MPIDRTLLRNGSFMLLWAGQTASVLGSQFSGIAFPVLAVTLLGANEFEMGLLSASGNAAFLLVGLPAGAWVDRWRKRRVLITADVVRAIAIGSLPLLWFLDVLAIWHLFIVGLIIGVATVFFDVSYQSYLPHIVDHTLLGPANSALETTNQISRTGGPAVVGVLVDILSAPVLIIVDAISFVISAVALRAIPDDEHPVAKDERRPLRTEIAEGLRFVFHQPVIRRVVINVTLTNFSFTVMTTLLPLLILRDLGISPSVMGIMMSVASIGGLLGAIATTPIVKRLGEGPVVALSAAIGALASVFMPIAGYADRPTAIAILVCAEFVFTFTVLTYNITQVSARQRLCPPELLGRMNASIRFFVWGVMPLGSLAAGILGTAFGLITTMWIGAVGHVIAALVMVISPLWGMRYIAPPAERQEAASGD